MSYRVLHTAQFHAALEAQLEYFLAEGAPAARISVRLEELLELMDSLDALPQRFPVAELESAIAGIELRKAVFGNYLSFYHIDDEKREVQLLGFRHGARWPQLYGK